MATPKLFVGTRGTNGLLEADRGYKDRTVAYALSAKTNRYAPAGAGGECIFTSLYAVVTFSASVTVSFTPYIDGVALETQTISFVQNALVTRQTVSRELALSVPILVAAVERGRVTPRGTWCQVEVSSDDSVQVIIEGIEIEYEVVRESKMPGVA